MSSTCTELERRNTEPVVSGATRKPSATSWRKRFRKKKKFEINTSSNKGLSLDDDTTTPDTPMDKEKERFSFDNEAGVHSALSSVPRRLRPLRRNWSIENLAKIELNRKFRVSTNGEEMLHGFSTHIPDTLYEEFVNSEEGGSNMATDRENVISHSLLHPSHSLNFNQTDRLSRSCESLWMNGAEQNLNNDGTFMRMNSENSQELPNTKHLNNDSIGKTLSNYQDKNNNSIPHARRKQGTTTYPEIRGRSVDDKITNSQESLDSSLSLLNLPVNHKRNRTTSPSRFGKRIARKFATLSQSNESILLHAVANQDYDMIEKILSGDDNDYDINYLYPPGVTILHQACVFGDFDIVKLFVEKGADVKIKTWTNLSPAKLAVIYGHFDVAQLLLLAGADVDDIKNGIQIED